MRRKERRRRRRNERRRGWLEEVALSKKISWGRRRKWWSFEISKAWVKKEKR